MKKLNKLIAKARIALNMWALWQQKNLQEIILDQFESDIRRVQHQVDLLSEFVKIETESVRKLRSLKESAEVHKKTIRLYEQRIIDLNRELVS